MKVLDKGFVELVDMMGDDLRVVNAARISFNKHKNTFDDKDAELINYLASHEHTAPFRHCYLTFKIKAPIFVFRQWMKHRIASDFNEISGRYVSLEEAEFFVPEVFRNQSKINKQGSEGQIEEQGKAHFLYLYSCKVAVESYNRLIKLGVCREQARCVLPLGLYSEVYWTASLQAVAHFIHLRTDSHAQLEIQEYANAVKELTLPFFEESLPALLNHAER